MNSQNPITATLVPESDRLNFLPKVFPIKNLVVAEALVYETLKHLSTEYRGGDWHFYNLSSGGFYMAPNYQDTSNIIVSANFADIEVSADAAGIIATLIALSTYFGIFDDEDNDTLIEAFHSLRDFAKGHAEASQIFHAID